MYLHHVPQNSELLYARGWKNQKQRNQLKVRVKHPSFRMKALKRIIKVRMNFSSEFWIPTEHEVTELGNIFNSA